MANNDPPVAPVPRRVSRIDSRWRHVLEVPNSDVAATRSGASDLPRHRRPGSTGSEPMSIESSPPRPVSAANSSFLIRVQVGKDYGEEVEIMRVHKNMGCPELVTEALRVLRPHWTDTDRSELHRAIQLGVLWIEQGQSTVIRPSNVWDVLQFVEQRGGEDLMYCLVVRHPERIGLDSEDDELKRSWDQCKDSYPEFF